MILVADGRVCGGSNVQPAGQSQIRDIRVSLQLSFVLAGLHDHIFLGYESIKNGPGFFYCHIIESSLCFVGERKTK